MRVPTPSHPTEGTQRTLDLLPPLTLFQVVAHAPTALDAWLGLGGSLLTALTLDPVLRELAILEVAAGAGCGYEAAQHEVIGEGAGVTADQAAAVRERRLCSECLAPWGPVLEVVRELVATLRCTQQSFEVLASRLGAREVVELLLVVGHYLGIAVLVNALDLAPDPPDGLAVLGLPQGQRIP